MENIPIQYLSLGILIVNTLQVGLNICQIRQNTRENKKMRSQLDYICFQISSINDKLRALGGIEK